jgi:DNA-binding PadR family transcriptional regulator
VALAESVRYGVLGLIVPGPTYAYAIAEEVRRWPMDPAVAPARRNVYHAVNWLVSEGFVAQVESVEREAAGAGVLALAGSAAPRKLIGATDAGKHAFDRWMASPLSTSEELLWRLGTARADQLPTLAEVLRSAEHDAYSALGALPGAELESIPTAWSASTKFVLLRLLLHRQLGTQVALFGDFARLLLELHAEVGEDAARR